MSKEIVNKYLEFLGLNRDIKTLDDITKLLGKHENTFPFSNFKVLIKEDIELGFEDIFIDFIQRKKSGYCFEHNKLIYEVLKDLGFKVVFFVARMLNNSKKQSPLCHRFTLLYYENEKYLIDVSTGFLSPIVPIKFGKDIVTYSHLSFSYTIKELEDNEYELICLEKGQDEYVITRFNLQKCYEVDFEMGHYFTAKNANSILMNNLIMSLSSKDEIRSLRNSTYIKIYKDKKEKISIASLENFIKIIKEDFNCNFTYSQMKLVYEKYISNN